MTVLLKLEPTHTVKLCQFWYFQFFSLFIEISITNGSQPGLDCEYKLVAEKGTQISVNFQEMDIHMDESKNCLTDYLKLEEPGKITTSLIPAGGLTFCGQQPPNYPGPSVIVSGGSFQKINKYHFSFFCSGGNSLVLKYHTDKSRVRKGTGFKVSLFCN